MARSPAAMKVTTIRFGTDLWQLLEDEAALVGVSVSQYIREAALARAASAAAARGDGPFERLAGAIREVAPDDVAGSQRRAVQAALAALARAVAANARADAKAVQAASRHAQRRADNAQSPPADRGASGRRH